jgi:hypothetical protein
MKKLFLSFLIAGLLIGPLTPAPAYAADVSTHVFGQGLMLPKTGQTTSYQDYDDGYYEKGSASSPQFVDNGDGTISDRITGLMWVKTVSKIIPGESVRSDNQTVTAKGDWATSTVYAAGDVVRDANGTQATAGNISAATAANPCVITVDNLRGVTTGELVLINDITGDMGTDVLNGNRYYVKVSLSAPWTMSLYTDNGLGTGANTTGKTYTSGGTTKRCAFYVATVGHTSGTLSDDIFVDSLRESVWTASAASLTTHQKKNWLTAITQCEALVYAGYSDWRLPNYRELTSILNLENDWPAINATFFPNTVNDGYWSSTTRKGDTANAWCVYFNGGIVGSYGRGSGYYVRPVRSQ